MKLETVRRGASVAAEPEGDDNRQALLAAGVYCVSVVGGPGCGKSTLLRTTAERLAPDFRVGVITADPDDPRRGPAPHGLRLVRVDLDGRTCIGPGDVAEALPRLDPETLDLLLVENVGSLPPFGEGPDLGQDATVTVFSAAAGDDKARRHPGLVRSSTAVLLNKTDLLLSIPFDVAAFRDDVRRINPDAPLFEVSALGGRGMVPWLNWLKRHVRKARAADDVSHWFG
jgi:hydrogenase nickel incorporation protein HypB